MRSQGTCVGRPIDKTRSYVTNLRRSAKARLCLVRNRWSSKNFWHWVKDVTLWEASQPYREANGVQIVAMLRTMTINALRLNGICSVTEGIAALAHDGPGMLRLLGRREAGAGQPSG